MSKQRQRASAHHAPGGIGTTLATAAPPIESVVGDNSTGFVPEPDCRIPRSLRVLFFATCTVLSGIANNVTFFVMGQRMTLYPMFLLYFTTAIYVLGYAIIAALICYLIVRRARMVRGIETSSRSSSGGGGDSSGGGGGDDGVGNNTSSIIAINEPQVAVLPDPRRRRARIDKGADKKEEEEEEEEEKGGGGGGGLISTTSPPRYVARPSFWATFLQRKNQGYFVGIGLLLIINGLFSQFANPFVDGNLQNVLYQLALPVTGITTRLFLNKRFSALNLLGSFLVLAGCLMVVLPPLLDENNGPGGGGGGSSGGHVVHDGPQWIWVMVFALSVLPNGLIAVVQERLFEANPGLDPVIVQFWTNLYTLFGYTASLPLTMLPHLGNLTAAEIADNQRDAFLCVAGSDNPLPPGCKEGAAQSVLLFSAAYLVFFLFLALLVKEVGAILEALVSAMVTPAAALALSFPFLMGVDAEPLTAWVVGGSVVVPVGILVYEGAALYKWYTQCRRGRSSYYYTKLTSPSSLHDDGRGGGDSENKPLLHAV
eukprot:UC1_evm2s664